MTTVFSTVVDMSIKGGVVILAVLLMRFLLLKAPKKFSYLLWSVAAFRLCVPVSFQAVFSIFSLRQSEAVAPVTPPAVTPSTPVIHTPPLTVPSAPVVTPPATSPTTPVSPPVVEAVPTPTLPVDTAVTQAEAINWESLLSTAFAVLWLVGLAAMVVYGIVSCVKLYRRMQNAVRLEGNVYASDRISSPFTLGFLKPRIYLPFGLDEREQAHIIAHERYHIKRLDHIVKPFAYLLLAAHWFNPLCWLAFNRMSMDMEMSCDEAILRRMSEPGSKAQYTETLLSVASANRFPAPSPLAFSDGGGAKQRIKHALNWKKPKVWVTALACMLCLVTLVTCAADKVAPKNAPETETPPVSESTAEYYTLPLSLCTVSDEFMAVSDLAYIYNDEEGSGWNLRLMFHHAVTGLQFIEVEESEETTAGKVLYEKESFAAGDALHITTYLNDTTANRGLSFLDMWGQRRYYTIEVSMKDGSLSLKEFGTQRARLKNRILAEGEAEEADTFEMDVTFDGQPDLLIEKKPTPPTGLWFDTYVWVEEENSYCHAEGWDLANFAVDQENKRILSHDSGDMRVFHTISYWDAETRQPVVEHQLLWGWRATDETQSQVEFWEYKNGDELVASYTVPAEEWGYVYTLNQEDPRFAPYFEPGSLWDLNGEKWRDFPLAQEFYDVPLVAKLSGVQGDYTSPSLPAGLTAEAIRADLERRTDLIPFEAALGGTNYFSGIHILSDQYVYATAGDDHHYENLLLQYYKTPEGSLQWALLGRYQWNGHSYYPMLRIAADKTPVFQISGETEFTTSDNIHTYIISQNQGSLQSEKTLTILNKTSGELVQTVQLTENEWFTKKPIYLVDVSFDGHVDIIVPHSRPASAAYFQAYIWDVEHNKYQYASHYESIPNIAVDSNNKLLLSHRTADKTTSYSMLSYSAEKCDIVEIRSIYWEPQENLNSILFQEFTYSNDGTSKLLQQFNAAAIDSITIDKTDSQVAPYFSNNSIWNLNGEKWNNLVIPVSEYNY